MIQINTSTCINLLKLRTSGSLLVALETKNLKSLVELFIDFTPIRYLDICNLTNL